MRAGLDSRGGQSSADKGDLPVRHEGEPRGRRARCKEPRHQPWHCRIAVVPVNGPGTVAGRRAWPPAAGPVAQWLEPAAHNGLVAGSSPAGPTTLMIRRRSCSSAIVHRSLQNSLFCKLILLPWRSPTFVHRLLTSQDFVGIFVGRSSKPESRYQHAAHGYEVPECEGQIKSRKLSDGGGLHLLITPDGAK